jgi:hypothetical protein
MRKIVFICLLLLFGFGVAQAAIDSVNVANPSSNDAWDDGTDYHKYDDPGFLGCYGDREVTAYRFLSARNYSGMTINHSYLWLYIDSESPAGTVACSLSVENAAAPDTLPDSETSYKTRFNNRVAGIVQWTLPSGTGWVRSPDFGSFLTSAGTTTSIVIYVWSKTASGTVKQITQCGLTCTSNTAAWIVDYTAGVTPPTALSSCAVDSIPRVADSCFVKFVAPSESGNDSVIYVLSTTGYQDSTATSGRGRYSYVASQTDSVKFNVGSSRPVTIYSSAWVWDATNGYSARCQATRTYGALTPPSALNSCSIDSLHNFADGTADTFKVNHNAPAQTADSIIIKILNGSYPNYSGSSYRTAIPYSSGAASTNVARLLAETDSLYVRVWVLKVLGAWSETSSVCQSMKVFHSAAPTPADISSYTWLDRDTTGYPTRLLDSLVVANFDSVVYKIDPDTSHHTAASATRTNVSTGASPQKVYFTGLAPDSMYRMFAIAWDPDGNDTTSVVGHTSYLVTGGSCDLSTVDARTIEIESKVDQILAMFPPNFTDQKISSDGYASPNFGDIDGQAGSAAFGNDYWHEQALRADSGATASSDTGANGLMMENHGFAHRGDVMVPDDTNELGYRTMDESNVTLWSDAQRDSILSALADAGKLKTQIQQLRDSLLASVGDAGKIKTQLQILRDSLAQIRNGILSNAFYHLIAAASDSGGSNWTNAQRDSILSAVADAGRLKTQIQQLKDSLLATVADAGRIKSQLQTLKDSTLAAVSDAGKLKTYLQAVRDSLNQLRAGVYANGFWHNIAAASDSGGSGGTSNWSNAQRDSILAAISDAGRLKTQLAAVRDSLDALRAGRFGQGFWHNQALASDSGGSASSNWSNAQRDSVLAALADAGKLKVFVTGILDSIKAYDDMGRWQNLIATYLTPSIWHNIALASDSGSALSSASNWTNSQRDSVLAALADAGRLKAFVGAILDTLQAYDNVGRFQALVQTYLTASFWHNVALASDSSGSGSGTGGSGNCDIPDSLKSMVPMVRSIKAKTDVWANLQFDTLTGRVLVISALIDGQGDSLYPNYVTFRPVKSDSNYYRQADGLHYGSGLGARAVVITNRTIRSDSSGVCQFPIIPNIYLRTTAGDSTSMYEFKGYFMLNGQPYDQIRVVTTVPDTVEYFNPFGE